MSCVEESLCQQLFSLANKTDPQPPEGDKHLSRRVKKRSWWGFKQWDGNFELNPWITAYRVYCFSYWKSWQKKATQYFGIKLICQNYSSDDTVDKKKKYFLTVTISIHKVSINRIWPCFIGKKNFPEWAGTISRPFCFNMKNSSYFCCQTRKSDCDCRILIHCLPLRA